MSEELTTQCINHRDNRHVRLYCDYTQLYKGNENKAKLIRILESWTNTKKTEWERLAQNCKEHGQSVPEINLWITMSFQQFSTYTFGTIGVDTVKKTLVQLIEKDKHVLRRINPETPYGSPQYLLNAEVVQKAIDALTPLPGVKFQGGGEVSGGVGTLPPPRGESYPLTRGEDSPPSNNSNKNLPNNQEITYGASNDDALTRQTEKEQALENEIANLKAQIAQILETYQSNGYPPEPQGGVTSTLAGNSTTADGGNAEFSNVEPTASQLHAASLQSTTTATTQSQAIITQSKQDDARNELQREIMPCANNDESSTSQPTEQGESDVVSDSANVQSGVGAVPGKPAEQMKQESGVSDSHEATKQQTLIEKPKQPQMPPTDMKWCAEKMVQITEARRICNDKQGAYFSTELRGNSKKSQRDRQIEAAKKVLALGITEEQYVKAYNKRNDDWWNKNRPPLSVEDMYAKTTKGVIRITEVLEELESRSVPTSNGKIRPFPTSQQSSSNTTSSFRAPTGMIDHEEMQKMMNMDPATRKAYALEKKRLRLEQEQQQRAAL